MSDATPTTEDDDARTIVALEERLIDSAVALDRAELEARLHEQFTEIALGTRYERDEVIEAVLGGAGPAHPEFSDVRTTRLSADVILLTYRTGGERPAWRTSVYARHGSEGWRIAHHHASPIPG